MKSRVKKRVIALMLCMVMVLSSGISTLAEGDAGTPEATEEVSSTNDESAVNTEPDTAVAEDAQSRSNTAVETETAAEENAPAEAEAQPKTAEAAPAENTEADAAAQTPVEETQTAETKDNAADAQSTEQSAENGEAVQEETTTPETENETAQNTETAPQPYEGKYEDDTIKITVNAEAGIVPEGAELSVTPIEKTKITDDMTAEEKAEAEKINEQYDLTEKKLNEDSEENEETMEGFLAYDISFLVNGEEVEPSGDVNVVMEFKEAAIPEGVSEDAAVTVKHLKEDETAEDGVVVEDMADKAEVQTTDKAEVEKVELTTDSFSTFTITWDYRGYGELNVNVNYIYIDADGDYQEFGKDEVPDFPSDIDIDEAGPIDLSDYIREIPGYTYERTTVNNYTGTEVSRLEAFTTGNYSNRTYCIGYLANGSNNRVSWLSSGYNGTKSGNVYIIYEEQQSGISITDDIINSGNLVGRISDDLQTTIDAAAEAGQTVEYKWYKNINNAEFNEVTEQKAGSDYNFGYDSEAGTPWLNVAIDQGALNENQTSVLYQVAVVINGEETARSNAFSIPYYDELQNGSFETPAYMTYDVNGDYKHETMTQTSNEKYAAAGGVWQTTGRGTGENSGKDIEILGAGKQVWIDDDHHSEGTQDGLSKFYSWQEDQTPAAADGDQFAELNCETAGALYQDVLTIQGEPLYYGLSHRARGEHNDRIESDIMRVVIMPTSIATTAGNNGGEIDTQAELLSYLNSHTSDQLEELGVYSQEYKSDDQSWHDYRGQYTPTANLTRFFFVAIDTAATGDDANTIGNFLDDVYFTQDLPDPDPDEYQIQITKEISGLSDDEVEALKEQLTFKITSNDSDAPLNNTTINANDSHFVWSSSDGVYTGRYTIIGNVAYNSREYEYTISEENENYGTYGVTTSVTVNNGTTSETDTANFTVSGQSRNIIHFTNSYLLSEMDVSFKKVDENGTAIPDVEFALYENEDSETPIAGKTATSDSDGNVTFEDLDAGTYVLRETETPQGYVKAGPWTITVGDPAGGYTITGTGVSGDSTEGYQIVNHSFSSSIDIDKSVKVVNYDDRTYEITLSAKSILDSITQKGEPVDVVLVFDTSKSMDFPGDLSIVENNVEVYDLNHRDTNRLEKDETYYCIRKNSAATVYKLWFNDNEWVYTDASAAEEIPVDGDKSIFEDGDTYEIYQANGTNTRLDYLKTAAQSFIDKLNTLSDENQVGLVTFAETANYKNDMVGLRALSDTYNDLTLLIQGLNNTYTASGTNQADGLKKAVEMLADNETTHEKYVILLTDGAPNWKENGVSVGNQECWNQIENQAERLKDSGVTLMTMGVGLTYVDAGITASGSRDELASEKLKSIASTADGVPYYFNTDNASELESYFDSLFATIVSGIELENVTVTDVIDPRFELVTKSIPEGGQYDLKTGTITWSGVNLPYVSGDGWTVSFTIKAKEDFMGGNVIPTNGAKSGVKASDGTFKPFPQPAVNVKSLGLEVPVLEETVYLGDSVNVAANVAKIKAVLAQKVASDVDTENDESPTFEIPESCQLTNEDILSLLNGTTASISKSYAYDGTDDVVGQFVYTLTVDKTRKPTETAYDENFPATFVGDEQELYTLSVQYVPKDIDSRPAEGYVYDPNESDTYGAESVATSATGTYKLNVIAGSIDIIKKLDQTETSDKDQTFNFVVYPAGGNDSEKIEVQIIVEANSTVGRLSEDNKALLTNVLKRGEWIVEEVPADGYAVSNVAVGKENNTEFEVQNDKITFTMGTGVDGIDTLKSNGYTVGRLGVAEFTNEKVTSKWQFVKVSSTGNNITLPDARFKLEPTPPDPDKTTYYGESDADGVIKWYEDAECSGEVIANNQLTPGTYTLTESTAPSGYVKSEESWTVEITSNGIRSVSGSGDAIETSNGKDGTVSYYFENDVLYDLPESGGSGIYWYMLGGVLLMMAGSLLVYKKRRGEVLRRK